MNSIGIISLGCSKNLTDSEVMLGVLSKGYKIEPDIEKADIIIVNTCCFIDDAKQESIDAILDAAEYKKKNCKKLVVAGCLAQRYKEEILKEIPEVDVILGTADYHRIDEILAGGEKEVFGDIDKSPDYSCIPRVNSMPFYTAYLKIADGCDNHCTYCVIPSIRGKFRSRTVEELTAEAESLAKGGAKEIIVIAQNTTDYGIDIYGKRSLAKLLTELSKIEDIHWIRLHYAYPEGIDDELIRVVADNPKICKYLDIPIQHANDTVLRRMGRRCTKSEMLELFEKIRKEIPDVTLRTSVIAGFPGETDEQAEELCEFIKEIRFDRLGAFSYSREEGTPAAKMDGQIDEDEKAARTERLMNIQSGISLENNKKKIGKTIEVLAEGFDESQMLYFGRSEADSTEIDGNVYFGSEREISEGEFVRVKILDCSEYDLFGKDEIL